MEKYNGIDVSKWQGTINWNVVKQSGVQFAMIRTGYGWGKNQKDVKFDFNYENAKKVGMPVGAYHYSYATTVEDAVKEAEFCYSIIKGKKFEYPIAFDVEEKRISDFGKTKVSEIIDAFCKTMEKYGYYVCVYANKYWLDNYISDEIFKNYDIWLAQWTDKPTFSKAYGIWQKSSKGKIDGIDTNVDINESYKNYPSIMKYNGLNGYGGTEPVVPPKDDFVAGQKIILNNCPIYATSGTMTISNYLSGTFYIYDGKNIGGRYRITNSIKNVERKPIGQHVTGFVNKGDLKK